MAESSQLNRINVTVLSADVVDSTRHIVGREPEYTHAFNNRCFGHVNAAVEAAGGEVLDRSGDGFLAVFGLDGLEPQADQACLAAWTIQHTPLAADDRPHSRSVRFRVGVHAGQVVRQPTAPRISGEPVYIAAKLQQSAQPGAIVVSDAVVRQCRSDFELAPLAAPRKGRAWAAAAYRLDSRPERAPPGELSQRYRYPLVGRLDELDQLRAHLPRAGAKSRSIALIGEAGVGKSRLAAEAAAAACAGGARAHVFSSDPLHREAPFGAAQGLIGELFQLASASSHAEVARALAEADAPDEDIGAIATLFGVRSSRSAPVTQTRLARALASAIGSLARRRPTLLVVEDLHLVDPESRDFLRLLAHEGPNDGLCLLVTGRPEALADAAAIAEATLTLEPLPTADMQALARLVWPTDDPSSTLIDRAVARAEGLPFVLEQLARSAEATDQAGFALPQSVETVIHMRLRGVPHADAAQATAQALSLLGEADGDMLQEVMAIDRDLHPDVEPRLDAAAVHAAVATLDRFAFLHPARDGAVRFRHHLIAEACGGTISLARRPQLHRAVFEALAGREAAPGGNLKISAHAVAAGLDQEALDYLHRAAREARGTSAAASLNVIFDRAMGVIERLREGDEAARRQADDRYVSIVSMAFPSMLILGEFDKMTRHLPPTLELVRKQGQLAKVSSFLSQLGMLCWFEGRYEEGRRATEEGLAIARDLGEPALVYANQVMLANVLHGAGRVNRALKELASLRGTLAGVPEAERWGSPSNPRASALGFTGWIMLETGRYEEAMPFAEQALEVAVRLDDPYSEVMARNAIGRCLLLMGRNEEAVGRLAAAMAIAQTNGYDATKANLTGHIAAALARSGRAAEGVALAEACLAADLHLRTGRMECYLLKAGYAEALVRAGRAEAGLASLDEALAIARSIRNPCLTASGLRLRAWLLEAIAPSDVRIAADLAEAAAICKRHDRRGLRV